MSDLASCCEYLTVEKSCAAVKESERARANRELQCQNLEKTACCYLCLSRSECTISCKYLGQTTVAPTLAEASKVEAESTFNGGKETEVNQTESALVICCSLCNVEMSQAKTEFRIDGWKGPHPKLVGNEVLPVIVCLCPRCGKIEFRADTGTNPSSPANAFT